MVEVQLHWVSERHTPNLLQVSLRVGSEEEATNPCERNEMPRFERFDELITDLEAE